MEDKLEQLITSVENYNLLSFLESFCNNNDIWTDEIIKSNLVIKFEAYIQAIKDILYSNYRITKKIENYSYEELAQVVFANNDLTQTDNINTHIKNCLIGIIKLLNETKNEAKEIVERMPISREILISRVWFYYYLLFHIETYKETVLMHFSKDISQKKHFFRTQILAGETLYLARRLPRNEIKYNDIAQAPVAAFLIRQAIELRTLELLQIKAIWNKKTDKPIKITADAFFPLLKVESIKPIINTTLLKKIHSWANPYVHMGGMLGLWQTEIARKAIEKFVYEPITITDEYMRQIPRLALSFVKTEDRDNCEIIMNRAYSKKYGAILR